MRTILNWNKLPPCWVLTLVIVAVLAPFLAKPLNMDDPLFVWAAQQIQSHPSNPYGFYVNWYGFTQPMWLAMQNPPLMSYYLALAAGIFGWSEIGLHLACWLPTLAVVLGTYRLAKDFCQWPQFAALETLFAPGFLLSSTTVMSDVAMLAFWIWAVVFWTEGIKQDNYWKLSAAGALIGLAIMTKYNAICIIPLLIAYGLLEKRGIGRWAAYLLIPLAILCANEWWTFHLYGHAHFFLSNQYAQSRQDVYGISRQVKALNTLTFTGGCFAAVLFCAPFLWRKGVLLLIAIAAAVFTATAISSGMMAKYAWLTAGNRFGAEAQVYLWTIGGMSVLALALADTWQKRDANSCLLALWVMGTFIFAAFVYWMVNGRVILPMAPAVAILLARRLEQTRLTPSLGIKMALTASAAVAMLSAQADFQLANSIPKGAEQIRTKYSAIPGGLWFEGHWGFQYYMQSFGARPLDSDHLEVKSGDILVMPTQNSNTLPPDPKIATLLTVYSTPVLPWFSTMNLNAGAGFYSQLWGPLPFAFGRIPPEEICVYALKSPPDNLH